MKQETRNDSQVILTQAIDQLKKEYGNKLDISNINLAELERRTGISRSRLRKLKNDGFVFKPHGRTGKKANETVLTGFTGVLDNLLRSNISNASVCYEHLLKLGYKGKLTQIRVYIEEHKDLLPPKRLVVSPQGNGGRRYNTNPGEVFQMDWGFAKITSGEDEYICACFAMICHHCGEKYIEFFPNAKQENLFIGMIHSFLLMGVPKYVLTDNMKNVVIGRDSDRNPIWQHDYDNFMKTVGFETKLCKPRHPYTKGSVERLVRFVKENFLAGRTFGNITDLNFQALSWCRSQNNEYHRALDCIPESKHSAICSEKLKPLEYEHELMMYLCPLRTISFDGFVSYEGRRFGVPYWYQKRQCRIQRKEYSIIIYDENMSRILVEHNVTWSRKDSFCNDQFATIQPEEFPTAPVKTNILQIETPKELTGFEKFNFAEGLWDE